MKTRYLPFILLSLTNAYAGPVERKSVQDKTEALKELNAKIIAARITADVKARDLKVQRDRLREQIGSLLRDYKTDSTTLKDAARRAINENRAAVEKLKNTPKLSDDEKEAATAISQATTEETALTQTVSSLDTVELPRAILD